uniref:Interleukin-1 n=2 Tax=Mastacembelus armatus TaxID=205130 RepID=A0A3Q3LYR4_9TELE
MCDFDLSQALDGPFDYEAVEPESSCSDMTDVEDAIIKLDDGLDLVVSHNPLTMQHMATLLLAVKKMKKSLTRCRQELSDEELCSAIMDSLVEETAVERVENPNTGRKTVTFQRVNSIREYTLCNTSKKDIVCALTELKLHAITLKGGNGDHKVNFKLSRYITNYQRSQIVMLSVSPNLHISCSMKGDTAELTLEECSEKELKLISNDRNMDRFLFYKIEKGIDLNKFESVACSNWYISTSYQEENQAVEMCKVDANTAEPRRDICFKINEKH